MLEAREPVAMEPRDLSHFSTEELFRQMEEEDEVDRVTSQTLASPIDYGKLRGIRAQRVYSYIRKGKLATSLCPCGRKCVEITEADKVFGFLEEEENE